MLLVILGAGASYDSVNTETAYSAALSAPPELSWRPPLTKDIFEARGNFSVIAQTFHQCLPLLVGLRQRMKKNPGLLLEDLLDEVQQRAGSDTRSESQLMAVRYYLRDALDQCGRSWSYGARGATNYRWLAERLDRWARQSDEPVIYVTFNYDTLLEEALSQELRHRFDSVDSYVSNASFKLIKVHGSVNWGFRLAAPVGVNKFEWVIDEAASLTMPQTIEIKDDFGSGVNSEAWVPALAVPLRSKDEFVCPTRHVDVLAELLPRVDRVLVIGWRATEKKFLELLHQKAERSIAACLVACHDPTESRGAWSKINTAVGSISIRGYAGMDSALGFSDLVESEEMESFLSPWR